jgi:hypothetical protein
MEATRAPSASRMSGAVRQRYKTNTRCNDLHPILGSAAFDRCDIAGRVDGYAVGAGR